MSKVYRSAETGHYVTQEFAEANPATTVSEEVDEVQYGKVRDFLIFEAKVEHYCEVMHDAYEIAAAGAGWQTQEASRKPWSEVPEENKIAMRAAVLALLEELK